MSHLKLGVVGVGALGRHHARILSEMSGVELVGVVDTRQAILDDISSKCGCPGFTDFHELLPLVDAAVIAVPTFAHESVAEPFLKRGIPLLIEKPLAANVAEAERIVQLAEESGTLLQVGHIERFNPATRVAWPLISQPRYIRAERYSPFAFRSMDIGVVLDVMIHDIDLVLDLVGSPARSVDSLGMTILGGHEDCVQARIVFENGCVADLSANRVHTGFQRSLQAFCEECVVCVDYHARTVSQFEPTERLLYGPSPLEKAAVPGADIQHLKDELFGTYIRLNEPPVPEADALTDELSSFVECVQTGHSPLVGGREALHAMQTAQRILDGLEPPNANAVRQAA